MDESRRDIDRAKRRIRRHFNQPVPTSDSYRSPRRFNNFRVIESIYSQEKSLYEMKCTNKLPGVKGGRKQSRGGLMEEYRERKGSMQRGNHTSKQMNGCVVDGYPNTLTNSWGRGFPELRHHPVRTAKLTRVIAQCRGVGRSSGLISTLRRQQTAHHSFSDHLNATELTIQQLDFSPGDLLEPLYSLRRESEACIIEDAQRYAVENNDNVSHLHRMIERQRKRRQMSVDYTDQIT